jgi:thiamine-monophosphate kinase
LRALIETYPGNREVQNRIGDDAAVWQPSRSHRSVVTSDALVENVHFRRDTMPAQDIGYRAMAANLSDLAAMGARPVLATVTLGLPADVPDEEVFALYRGMLELAAQWRCSIAGGDLSSASALVIAITAIGQVRPARIKSRAGARPGDVIAVTGELGASRAGLHAAQRPQLAPALLPAALAAHRRPQPRIAEGAWLAASANVHAMMDISDGLSTDLERMCAASDCAAVIDRVPVAACAGAMAELRHEDPCAYALAGGEDYELLVSVAPRAFEYLSARFQKHFGKPLLRVAQVRAGSGVHILRDGREEPLAPLGWDHFANVERIGQ